MEEGVGAGPARPLFAVPRHKRRLAGNGKDLHLQKELGEVWRRDRFMDDRRIGTHVFYIFIILFLYELLAGVGLAFI